MKKEFKDLCISKDATMLQAMEQMDRVRHKLLMVMEGESFMGLLSIGAIQRAIVRGISPKSSIGEILRKDIVVCKVGDSDEKIKAEMLKCRAEYMPIVQPRNTLNTRDGDEVVDVVFWEDLFEEAMHTRATVGKYDLPVVVMAGGEGTRLRPLTNILPKPLLPIGKKTIIESIMDRFV
ncbi:MAG: CBS domain-containing protein, partial [Kiritimatiellae bacterium]|nr:CBS domain-containing protein [Kiritimatiellia bacterium]